MAYHLQEKLDVEDWVNVKGPYNKLTYDGYGKFRYMNKPINQLKKHIAFIIGDDDHWSPLLQILKSSLYAEDDRNFTVLFQNRKWEDTVCIFKLKERGSKSPVGFLRVFNTLTDHT